MHQIGPVVNNNGDKRDVLVQQGVAIREALDAAQHAMQTAFPHGRNYQTGGTLMRDRAEAERRIRMVRMLADQYQQEAVMLANE